MDGVIFSTGFSNIVSHARHTPILMEVAFTRCFLDRASREALRSVGVAAEELTGISESINIKFSIEYFAGLPTLAEPNRRKE